MTTERDAFDERLTRLEAEVAEIKAREASGRDLLGELATLQAQMLTSLNRVVEGVEANGRRLDNFDRRFDRLDQRTEDIARHLGVPPRNGGG